MSTKEIIVSLLFCVTSNLYHGTFPSKELKELILLPRMQDFESDFADGSLNIQ